AAILRTADGHLWQFRCKGGALGIEDSIWMDAAGRPLASRQLVITAETPPGGTNLSWLFHRAK
ncbi:MAG: heparinase, partial [Sphingomonadales bacterium]